MFFPQNEEDLEAAIWNWSRTIICSALSKADVINGDSVEDVERDSK